MRAPAAARKPSLSSRLLQHVTLPLALTWALGAAIAVGVGDIFTEQAFDRSLLDDAYVLASHVEQEANGLELSLSSEELDAVLFDQSEEMFYAVRADDGSLLAGQPGLETAAQPSGTATYAFSTILRDNQRLRAVVLRQRDSPGFDVIVAQTTQSRTQLLRRLLAYSIVPQLVLLGLVAWGLRRVVRQDLAPLAALQESLDARDASDLTPLPGGLVHDAGSRELERVGQAIDALLARVGDGVKAQREFAGNVAHELRTPLAGIRALAEYGLAQSDPQALRESLQSIAAAQSRASHLIDQLLAMALADESRQSPNLAPIQLGEVAREVVLRFLPRADHAGVDLGAEGLEPGAKAMANVALLEGALGNLIDNALRHGRETTGGPPVVTVQLNREPGSRDVPEWRLSVIDNGPGMSLADRSALRQRWVQGEAAKEGVGGGVGLGLAIVARDAELLGARFELAQVPGRGGLSASLLFQAVD